MNIEYVIWGVAKDREHEEVLYTKSSSMKDAKRVIGILEEQYGATKCRVQVLDLDAKPDFSKIFTQ